MNFLRINLNPPQSLIIIFLTLITLGAILLKIPMATEKGISWVDALFTATSAMTVTGLIVLDTGNAFTLFGEIIIMTLIQLGGIGIMTFAILIFVALGRKIGIKERLVIKQALNQPSLGGIIRLAKRLLIFSLIMESFAAIILSLRWGPEMGWQEGIYASIFHSISAFNNAGFSIWSDSLSSYVSSPIVNLVITVLFMIGGIGFTVVFDVWVHKEFKEMSLQTKLMLSGTLAINLISIFIILILEYNNPQTIGDLSSFGKLQASYFQAVTPRTAGFNTIDIGNMEETSLFYIIMLMFIGGGSTSTAGGIKLTTFITIILATLSFFKDREHLVVYRRMVAFHTILRSLSLAIASMAVIFLGVFILSLTEDSKFLMVLFEVVSAFGTVGLSMGLTGSLTVIGKIVIIFIMFVGKLGPLTLAFAFSKQSSDKIKYPKSEILTG